MQGEIVTQTEEQVLGAALAESGHWLQCAGEISAEDFATYRTLARVVLDATERRKATDPLTMRAALVAAGAEMPLADLMRIEQRAPFSQAAMQAAVERLREASQQRLLAKVAEQIKTALESRRARADEICRDAAEALNAIGAKGAVGYTRLRDDLRPAVQSLDKPPTGGVKTGIAALDKSSGGLKAGELAVLGGRPSMGKTSLAMNIAAAAAKAQKTVLFFSLEMTTRNITKRTISDLAQINLGRLMTHRVSQTDMRAITAAAAIAHDWEFYISRETSKIEPVCRQVQHRHGLDLVVIDYLQLMECRAESRELQISKITRGLNTLAIDLGVPFLVLSQLNREIEKRPDKRPRSSDLRESGAIEQDADLVMLLWREGYYDPDADQSVAELVVTKNRNGDTGAIKLHWDPTTVRFTYQDQKSP